ncbi:Uncharacterized conserved protein, DUF885 familyt [Pseudidiomarina planktonica]|uniref:Uncharacterized conserved protein, DUF885 familyt n=1 Tax=Pseudidiomarina planktonica TaxID=1323738 RepID=A0A1Y6EPF8_9GAMM|nr:DUF885 domain-containing protein [Pseudidiomarina planktonica]SMQ62392.1 Uncharacterized conserved protein, DUF885 familyt [Pseudidiomarina planktonica]
MWKWIGGIFAVLLVVVSILVVNAIWFKPFSINVFYERAMLKTTLDSPQLLTQLGLLERFGIDGHNARLDDLSVEARAQSYKDLADTYATFSSYSSSDMNQTDSISYAVFDYFLQQQMAGERWQHHGYPVNQLFGVQNTLPSFFVNMHKVNDATGAEHYISRLHAVHDQFIGLINDIQQRAERDIIPPKFVLTASMEQIENFLSGGPGENLLLTSFADKLADTELTEAERTDWLEQAETALTEAVFPAYQNLYASLESLQAQADNTAGVWKLPDGDAYYNHMLKQHTTTDLTANEIHELGLAEVARIQADMQAIFSNQGYTSGTVGELLAQINEQEEFLYPDTDAGREQILADYKSIITDIKTYLGPAFRIRPEADLDVRRVPEFAEKNAPGAYYQSPAIDGSRPGVFFANLYNINDTPTFGMKTLAVHEGIPGHHFQLAIQQELDGLPTFRKFVPFTVYSEGWALYTEQLMYELDLYGNDPFGNLGRLQAELFRAVRLVVDTGIHAKRWTREQAIDYMQANTGMTESSVTSEIERYIVMPGQATSYKIGMLKLVELRNKARTELGSSFDLRDFHDVVLQSGSLPLPILEQVIDQFIEMKLQIEKAA